jgi:probable phosphoglycerate mutase
MRTPEWTRVQRWPSSFRFPGGESFSEMSSRATEAVLRIAAEHPGKTVVAVSHADPIRAVLARLSGIPMDLFQRLTVSTCSVSAVSIGANGPRILSVNTSADELVRA